MKLRDYELRSARSLAAVGGLFALIGVLQLMVGRWWIAVPAFLLATSDLLVAAGAWALAKEAEEWETAEPKRPPGWMAWLVGAAVAIDALNGLLAVVGGKPLDAMSWLLAAAAMSLVLADVKLRRRLTEPAKEPARFGPPQEWL